MATVDLAIYANRAKIMLDELHIEYDKTAPCHFEETKSPWWGICRRRKNNTFDIAISTKLLYSNKIEEAIMSVVLHEYLHTVRGCFNHGKLWKYYASIIRNRFGVDITREASYNDCGIDEEYADFKYKVVCNTCGEISYYKRAGSIVNGRQCICTKCHGTDFTVYNADGSIRPKIESEPKHKYTITCESCGKMLHYERASKVTRNYEHYHCRCGGHLKLTINY